MTAQDRDEAPGHSVPSGVRVLLTRSPDRAAELVRALREIGFTPVLAPVHQAAPVDGGQARDLRALITAVIDSGAPHWLALTSANTVRALVDAMGDESGKLADALRQAVDRGLRVAAVGAATARAAEDEGLRVDLVPPPEQASARGMVEVWPDVAPVGSIPSADESPSLSGGLAGPVQPTVFLPQSGQARTTLADGLRERGWEVRTAAAYRMLPWPADEPLVRPEFPADVPAQSPVWSTDRARSALEAGDVGVVVATSPLNVKALLTGVALRWCSGTATSVGIVAIGEPTRRAVQELGLTAHTARTPDADGLLEAVLDCVREITDETTDADPDGHGNWATSGRNAAPKHTPATSTATENTAPSNTEESRA